MTNKGNFFYLSQLWVYKFRTLIFLKLSEHAMEKTSQVAVLLKFNLPDSKNITNCLIYSTVVARELVFMVKIEDASYWPDEN